MLEKQWEGKMGEMSYRIYCFLAKIPHVRIEKFNRKNRILRYKIFPNSTKNVGKKEGVCRTEFTVILQNFRMWGRKIQSKQ